MATKQQTGNWQFPTIRTTCVGKIENLLNLLDRKIDDARTMQQNEEVEELSTTKDSVHERVLAILNYALVQMRSGVDAAFMSRDAVEMLRELSGRPALTPEEKGLDAFWAEKRQAYDEWRKTADHIVGKVTDLREALHRGERPALEAIAGLNGIAQVYQCEPPFPKMQETDNKSFSNYLFHMAIQLSQQYAYFNHNYLRALELGMDMIEQGKPFDIPQLMGYEAHWDIDEQIAGHLDTALAIVQMQKELHRTDIELVSADPVELEPLTNCHLIETTGLRQADTEHIRYLDIINRETGDIEQVRVLLTEGLPAEDGKDVFYISAGMLQQVLDRGVPMIAEDVSLEMTGGAPPVQDFTNIRGTVAPYLRMEGWTESAPEDVRREAIRRVLNDKGKNYPVVSKKQIMTYFTLRANAGIRKTENETWEQYEDRKSDIRRIFHEDKAYAATVVTPDVRHRTGNDGKTIRPKTLSGRDDPMLK